MFKGLNGKVVFAVFGVIATAALSAKAAQVCSKKVEISESDELQEEEIEHLKKIDRVKKIAYTASAVAMCGLTVTVILKNNLSQNIKTAGMIAAYDRYKSMLDKTRSISEKEILNDADCAIMETLETEFPEFVDGPNEIGRAWFYDPALGRAFRSSMVEIQDGLLEINQHLGETGNFVPLNEFYSAIGLKTCDFGRLYGWFPDNPPTVDFTSTLTKTGTPVTQVYLENLVLEEAGATW